MSAGFTNLIDSETPQTTDELDRRTAQQLREDVLHRASYGEITADEAEAEAKRLGLEPFARVPDPAKFDPADELNWTLPMAVAWIAYRSLDAVREVWPAYRAKCWDWHWSRWRNGPGGEVHEGWSLDQRSFASLPHLELSSILERAGADARPMIMSVKEAREALWIVLGDSGLVATGVSRLGGSRTIIAANDWLALKPLDSDHRDEVGRDGVGIDFAEPLVSSRGVRHLWGPRRDRLTLRALMAPTGDGYMPLGCAAQWIATEGGKIDFDPKDDSVWRQAFDLLLGAIASEKVRVVGLRSGVRERVPGFQFAGCVVDYPFADASLDMIISGTVYLRCYPYIDEQHWRDGFDDALISRHKDHWTQLMVEKGDVRQRWSFEVEVDDEDQRTGLAGRPGKSRELIDAEFQRRVRAGELAHSVTAEAQALLQWLAGAYPRRARPTARVIENNIRAEFNRRGRGTK